MAEKVGIDRSFLADVEREKRNISILKPEAHCVHTTNLTVETAVSAFDVWRH